MLESPVFARDLTRDSRPEEWQKSGKKKGKKGKIGLNAL
jgi:hypothetical protein